MREENAQDDLEKFRPIFGVGEVHVYNLHIMYHEKGDCEYNESLRVALRKSFFVQGQCTGISLCKGFLGHVS